MGRKIVVDTSGCKGCEGASMIMQVWGADDALTVHDCTTQPLTISSAGLNQFERELGGYAKTQGCYQAPLDARVSDGKISWDSRVKWRGGTICFEWLDEKKFPLDCKVYETPLLVVRPIRST